MSSDPALPVPAPLPATSGRDVQDHAEGAGARYASGPQTRSDAAAGRGQAAAPAAAGRGDGSADQARSVGQDRDTKVGRPDSAAPARTRPRAEGRDRPHSLPGRRRQVKLRYSDEEYADLAAAARSAGLTPSGYAAEAALAAAAGLHTPSLAPLRAALVELITARGQVRRFGTNVNQAVRALNATGEAPTWLAQAVTITTRAVTRLDDAAADLAAASRRSQRRATPRTSTGATANAATAGGAR